MTIDPAIALGVVTFAVWLGALEYRMRRVEKDCAYLLLATKRIEWSQIQIKQKLGIPIKAEDLDAISDLEIT